MIKSKQRVTDYGEVFTPPHIVNAMLDLVKPETERIDSRFLEPACGTGNFLAEILERKLRVVKKRYGRLQLDYERYALLAASASSLSVVQENRQGAIPRGGPVYLRAQHPLTLKTPGDKPEYLVFSEWSLVNGSLLKRRDFSFHELIRGVEPKDIKQSDLFSVSTQPLVSDLGQEVFIPVPEYPPVHFLEVAHA